MKSFYDHLDESFPLRIKSGELIVESPVGTVVSAVMNCNYGANRFFAEYYRQLKARNNVDYYEETNEFLNKLQELFDNTSPAYM